MIDLEVYAAGIRELHQVRELANPLAALPGPGFKVDRDYGIDYLERNEPFTTFRKIRGLFLKLELELRFVRAIPPELQPRSKMRLLGV